MAGSQAVWGLEIGRSALKALRCRLDGDAIIADAFDFIEYPKLLSQPDADVPTLVREALNQFLSRNSVRGDKVAIAVSGESGLAKYFKPPPVDRGKIADIVKYEAKQQIPFALEDVIWDYQLMPGYRETDGFVMEADIGLFAMKREQVLKVLQPYIDVGIEVDIIQLAPLAVYNYVAFDLAKQLKPGEEYEPDRPPPSFVVMSMGTDTTDLVVTNGFRLWQRNIPLGGNHFTKQLSKDLKLTFAKAEHLKRNPKQAEDPKTIFTSMRPVFADIVTEVQRSISFYRSLDRKADIQQLVMLGNTVKLPGLQQYVVKHLGQESADIGSFNRLNGSSVISAPSFKENILSFATCYGLCVQGLGKGKLSTNLLPKEFLQERMIRAKKPWAVAAVGGLLLGCAFNFIFHFSTWNAVHPDRHVNDVSWSDSIKKAESLGTLSTNLLKGDNDKKDQLKRLRLMSEEVVGGADRRLMWLELTQAINSCLPVTPELKAGPIPPPSKLPFHLRQELHIQHMESEYFPESAAQGLVPGQPGLKAWYNDAVRTKYNELVRQLQEGEIEENGEPPAENAQPPAANPMPPAGQPVAGQPPVGPVPAGPQPAPAAGAAGKAKGPVGPTGSGWVIELHGYHFYQPNKSMYGAAHVRATLLKNLETGEIELPLEDGTRETFTFKELGISYPILAHEEPINPNFKLPNPNFEPPINNNQGFSPEISGETKKADDPNKPVEPPFYTVAKYTFTVQFVWQEKRLSERLKARQAAAAPPAAGGNPPVIPGVPARPPITATGLPTR